MNSAFLGFILVVCLIGLILMGFAIFHLFGLDDENTKRNSKIGGEVLIQSQQLTTAEKQIKENAGNIDDNREYSKSVELRVSRLERNVAWLTDGYSAVINFLNFISARLNLRHNLKTPPKPSEVDEAKKDFDKAVKKTNKENKN